MFSVKSRYLESMDLQGLILAASSTQQDLARDCTNSIGCYLVLIEHRGLSND